MSEFVTEAFTLLGVAIVIIGLRTAARWIMVGPKNFQADDYVMLVACVSTCRRCTVWTLLIVAVGIRSCTDWKRLLHTWLVRGFKVWQTIL